LCFDIDPQVPGVVNADSGQLPLATASIGSVVYDPPFITYVKKGRSHGSVMSKRFGGYYTYDELLHDYRRTITECSRVLRARGILVVKCQDIIHNHKIHPTHINVVRMAEENGMRLKDLFILVAKHRMPVNRNGKQKHARIWHSYFLVFEKSIRRDRNDG